MGFPGALDVTCTYRLKIPGHAVDRADRDHRRADAVQSRASFLLQSRRRRQRRHSRPPADAGCGRLSAGRRRNDPDRRRPAGRRHAVRFPPGAADPHGDGRRAIALRSQFLPRRARAAAAAGGLGARRRHPASRWRSGRPSPACSSTPATRSRARRTGSAAAHYKAYAGFCLEPQVWPDSPNRALFPAGDAVAGRDLPADDGIPVPVAVRLTVERRPQHLERRQRAAHLHDGRRQRMGALRAASTGAMPAAARRDRRH